MFCSGPYPNFWMRTQKPLLAIGDKSKKATDIHILKTATLKSPSTRYAAPPSPVGGGVAIFWDIENVPMWKRFLSLPHMMSVLRGAFGGRTVSRMIAIGSLERVTKRTTLAELQRNGVYTVDCSLGHPNAADLVIVAEMMRCWIETRPHTICLISNDGGFAHSMSMLRQMGCNTVIMHDRPSKHLAQAAHVSIDLRRHYAS